MPINDIIREQTGPQAAGARGQQSTIAGMAEDPAQNLNQAQAQALQQARQARTSASTLSVGRNDLEVALQLAELVLLLLILTKL